MTSRALVDEFLAQERIAVVGVSASGKGFGAAAFKALRAKGLHLVPVHREAESIDGEQAYGSLRDIPGKVGAVLIVVPPEQTERVVEEAAEAGIPLVWMQQGAESERAIRLCQERGLREVHGECILMFARPLGFPHSLHRWVRGLFGGLPR